MTCKKCGTVCKCVIMSLRRNRNAASKNFNSSIASGDAVHTKNSLSEVFKQKASFSGAVGTTYDVKVASEVSTAYPDGQGGYVVRARSEVEWIYDVTDLLSTLSNLGLSGTFEILKLLGPNESPTGVTISMDQVYKVFIVMMNNIEVNRFAFESLNELVNFLAENIQRMGLSFRYIIFRSSSTPKIHY